MGTFILENWPLFLALVFIIILLLMNSARGRLLGFNEIKTAEAVQIMSRDDPVVIDTRSPEEFSQGHILNALNIPHDQMEARLGELEPHKQDKVIVYCRTGQRSAKAASILAKNGFTGVYKMNGGMLAWQGANLPVVTSPSEDGDTERED
ncbi:MAG TPA: rhodanese-like domain-containing protein [Chromatiales bacterium]|nr:rhodanese-like domain-containing protein [Chromatiales bacterium]